MERSTDWKATMSESKSGLGKGCLAFVALMALMVPAAMWSGWVLTKLWAWFLVPTFGAPVLPIAAAIGIAALVSFITYQSPVRPAKMEGLIEAFLATLGDMFVRPLFALGFGWIVQGFMPGA